MSWEHIPVARGTRLRAPEDGIVASLRPRGWLARRWMATIDALDRAHQTRVARGRTFAHSGRVRGLWFSPGLANAEVVDTDVHGVSLRVRVLEDAEWQRILDVLLADLRFIAALIEGDLSREFVEKLKSEGIALFPGRNELGGDCDCPDYLLPCAHMAAVHHLLADALDGDPFLLLTLRGWTREHLLSQLQAAWGDDEPVLHVAVSRDEAPPRGDWLESPADLPDLDFNIRPAETPAFGLKALGPPPGEMDLGRALQPLYVSGAEAAMELALADDEPTATDERAGFRARARHSAHPEAPPELDATPQAPLPPDPSLPLTEAVVDRLAELESATSNELARHLGVDRARIVVELTELEELGIVYRTGRTRGTRWWLG